MISHTIFKDRGHTWLAFGQDPNKPEKIIDTNQIVITSGEQAIVLDPGGLEIFPPMLAALTDKVPIENVKHLFMSHQDPDIGSSLPLWRQVCNSEIEIHLSWLWTSFVAHFDAEANLSPIPDEGAAINLGTVTLELIPAHYLHSSGNFSVYDRDARILWTGDIGAALLPPGVRNSYFVEDFASHVQYMEGFHKRWMGSTRARDAWINRVSKLDIDILTPQHGLFFKGDDVGRFLDWFGALEVGSGIESMGAGDTPSLPTLDRTAPLAGDESSAEEEVQAEEAQEVEAIPEPDPIPEPEPEPAPESAAESVEDDSSASLPEYDEATGGYVFPDS